MEIQTAVLERADGFIVGNKIEIETVELDDNLRSDEVLIRVTSCGVCSTDRGCLHGLEPYPIPGILGHEGTGVVEKIGANVSLVKAGGKVIIGFPFDGMCENCPAGHPRYCVHEHDLMFSGYRLDGSTPLTRTNGEILSRMIFSAVFVGDLCGGNGESVGESAGRC